MPFCDGDDVFIKSLYQFKGYGSCRLLTEFPIREDLTVYWKIFGKQDSSTKGSGVADRSTHVLENVTTDHCWWTCTKTGRPATNTSFNTPDIQRDWHNSPASYGSFTAILSELSEVSENSPCSRLTAAIVSFSYINVSQGSIVTQLNKVCWDI